MREALLAIGTLLLLAAYLVGFGGGKSDREPGEL